MFSEKPDLGQQTTKCPGQTEAPSQRHRSAETAATLSHHHTSQHHLVHQWSQWAHSDVNNMLTTRILIGLMTKH